MLKMPNSYWYSNNLRIVYKRTTRPDKKKCSWAIENQVGKVWDNVTGSFVYDPWFEDDSIEVTRFTFAEAEKIIIKLENYR